MGTMYNKFAKQLNAAFTKAAEKQRDAYEAYQAAQLAREKGPDTSTPERYAGQRKAQQAELDAAYDKAKAEMKATQRDAWNEFYRTRDRIGRDLENEVTKADAVNPDAIDNNVLTLLHSDMMTANDYQELYNRYSDNATMRRMIGNEAQKAADDIGNTTDAKAVEDRRTLTAIAYDSKQNRTGKLKEWDNLCNVSGHYSGENSRDKDPGYICRMNQHWADENTQAAINDF